MERKTIFRGIRLSEDMAEQLEKIRRLEKLPNTSEVIRVALDEYIRKYTEQAESESTETTVVQLPIVTKLRMNKYIRQGITSSIQNIIEQGIDLWFDKKRNELLDDMVDEKFIFPKLDAEIEEYINEKEQKKKNLSNLK